MNLTGRSPAQKPEKCRLSEAEHRAHKSEVKRLACVICGAPGPSDAHHVICGRYGSKKPCDCHVIPLCKKHHQVGPDAIHNGKSSWVERHGPDHQYLERVQRSIEDKMLGQWF